ncbi:hypothetical protein [Halomonas dongshanensis]|uniref:Uncharacterized protein n=1 Tax=Halomonas dongshanensis TaxID=2890835 RepID=A0ABT2EB09_9GAMM|nr:hypothetical protein [Halomonas dongshanensis]MCS2608755.1 hypothetical protein [Halomonas dongshanensis]
MSDDVQTLGHRELTPNERFHVRQIALFKRLGLHATAIIGAIFGLLALPVFALALGLLLRFQFIVALIAAATAALMGYLARSMIRHGRRRRLHIAPQVSMIKGILEERADRYSNPNGGVTILHEHIVGPFEFIRPLDAEVIFRPFVGRVFEAHVVELYYQTSNGALIPLKKKREAVLLKLGEEVDIDGVYRTYGRLYFYRYFLGHAMIIGPSALLSLVLMHYTIPLASAYGLGFFTGMLAMIVPLAVAFAVGSMVYFLYRALRKRIDPGFVKTHKERLRG